MDNLKTTADSESEDVFEYRGPSKSQLKRDMHRLQKLAGDIADLKAEIRANLGLPDLLLLSIEQAAKLKPSNARNRQLRHSAKLMEGEVELLENIFSFFDQRQKQAQKDVHRHKIVELWRDRLLDLDSNALSDFFDEFPATNRQELSTLVRNARKEKQAEKPPAAQRKLFKYLRDQAI